MRQGRVYRRCEKCRAQVADRRCAKCGSDRVSWAFMVDVAPAGATKRAQRGRMGFATKAAAVAAMHELQRDKARGTHVEVSKVTLGGYLEQWMAAGCGDDIKPWTQRGYRSVCRTHIIPRLGGRLLQALTTPEVKAFYADLRQAGYAKGRRAGTPLSEKSVHNVHICLRAALNDAVRDGLLRSNPAAGALRPPRSAPETTTWTVEELQSFLASCVEHQDRNLALFHVAAFTGMRRGELLGLRWRDVKWELATLSVQRQLGLREAGAEAQLVDTKTDSGRRAIGLDQETVAVLREHREAQEFERRRWAAGYQDRDLLFCRPDGSPHDPDTITAQFERAAVRAGLPRIRLHDVRHTHATLLLEAGVDISVVSRRLGHSSVAFTAKIYAHVTARLEQQAAARFRDYLSSRAPRSALVVETPSG